MEQQRFLTEYRNIADDGATYAGPVFLADTFDAANALTTCVFGPHGEKLTVIGVLAETVSVEQAQALVRFDYDPKAVTPTRES